MKGFLHIGTPKTATTTLQGFLGANSPALLEDGVIFTSSAGVENNLYLAVAAYGAERRDELTRLNNIHTDEQLLSFQNKIIRNLQVEIDQQSAVAGENACVVFSSEYFHLLLRTSEDLFRLKTVLNSIGIDDIEVVVYLREPADLAESYFSTSVKMGAINNNPQSPDHDRYKNLCDHKNTLERFASVFGRKNITARIFQKKDFAGGSIFSDFLSIIDVPPTERFVYPDSSNASLSAAGIQIQNRLNKIFPRWIGDELNPLLPMLVNYVSSRVTGASYTMPPSLRDKYSNFYSESTEWVRGEYFSDRTSLFADHDPLVVTPEDTPDTEVDDLALATAVGFLEETSALPIDDVWRASRQVPAPYGCSKSDILSAEFQRLFDLSTGVAEFNLGRYESAVLTFEKVLVSHHTCSKALVYKAQCLSRLGDYQNADLIYETLNNRFPEDYSIHRLYALNAEAQEMLQESADRWIAALQCVPDHPEALRKSGVWGVKSGRFDVALSCFDALLSGDADDTQAMYFKSRCLVGLQQYHSAEEVLLALLSRPDTGSAVFVLYAAIAEKQEKWSDAGSRWLLAAERFPDHSDFRENARLCAAKEELASSAKNLP